ncbi:Uncharacterised protein [Mycobacteroides abscessus]|nr:Uncharacterised protein [Mycobacteroides abscessus]
MGLSGWSFMGLRSSGSSPTNRWPRNTVRPASGKPGTTTALRAPVSSSSASATGPMLPSGVESNVEQYLS